MSNLPASKPKPATHSPDQSSTVDESGSVYPDPRTSWANRAWVAGGSITVFISLVKCIAGAVASQIWVKPILAGVIGYFLADFLSGLYHWAIDNYWDTTSPIIGDQVDYFLKHHKWPSLILKYKFSNLLRSLGRGVTCTILPIILVVEDPTLIAFVGSLSGFLMFSLQFHAWAHANPSKLPKIVVGLQNMGVLVSQSNHAAHHRAPINSSYCLVSGFWNKLLDENKVFMKLENLVFSQFGVKPRSWQNEPNVEGIEESYTPS